MQLSEIVPWGRNEGEYEQMFALGEEERGKRILSCGDGPASFNAERHQKGQRIISLDPIYQFSAEQIRQRVNESYLQVSEGLRAKQADYVWKHFPNVDALCASRLQSMEAFLTDYDAGKAEGRYVAGKLPLLPFASKSFDLVLSSHFLLLYSDHLDLEFHLAGISEMLRIAAEIRIFPVLAMDNRYSKHLDAVCAHFSARGLDVALQRVDYEFQKGGNEMLVIRDCS